MRAAPTSPLLAALFLAIAATGFAESYRAVSSGLPRFTLTHSPAKDWTCLDVPGRYRIWLRTQRPARYVVQFSPGSAPREFRHELTGEAVLPSMSPWPEIWPRIDSASNRATYLGHSYKLEPGIATPWTPVPEHPVSINLRPDLWIGQASNNRQVDERRRYDTSDYQYVPLSQSDYRAMSDAGITVVKAAGAQQQWAQDLGLYFWGPHDALPYPELLYNSQYLGPTIFLDEPAVSTRDHDLRPRLAKDTAYRKSITPQEAFRVYQEHYAKTITSGPPGVLMRTLAARKDVDLGTMRFPQQNLYNWETMPETAGWALSQDPDVPSAMVFEPPGRIGTRRTLPELNMTYGARFAIDDMRVLPALVFGFLRGAARLTSKSWGVSIYGAVERADASWWLTLAYDQGAERFFFWDNYQLACVPFNEVLALARQLRTHASQHPRRDLAGLKRSAERAILLPPGYGLGHVQMGRGNLWGIHELNLERRNRHGVKYREVMSRFFAEIERSLRDGISFDLFWDLPGFNLARYREVVRVSEDSRPAAAASPEGPELSVDIQLETRKATARVKERYAPVYYTHGADPAGVYHNAMVLFELYGPGEEDYQFLMPKDMRPNVRIVSQGVAQVEAALPQSLANGKYRLRAAATDTMGRSTVVWQEIDVQ